MGCKTVSGKIDNIKKTLLINIVVAMFVAAVVTPVVFAAHSDYVSVSFTAAGDISLEVNKSGATFGSVTAGTGGNDPTEGASTLTYALFNNGSVAAHCYIDANASTDSTEWSLDDDGTPGVDAFSIHTVNNSGGATQFFSDTNKSWIDSLAGGGGSNAFGLKLGLGNASGSSVLDAQLHRLNFTGAPV
jgi:hypothetical protein